MLSADRGMSRFEKEPPAPAGGVPLEIIRFTHVQDYCLKYYMTLKIT
jgi:hypothetical protein